MRWEEERYVRVYTRDTGDWLSLSFEAQGVWMLMLRKFDRSGHIHVGKGGRRMLAAVLGHPAQQELVDRALDEILAVDFVEISGDGSRITSPNFRAAQDWVKTPAERAKEYRDRKRAESQETVTERHAPSRTSRERHPSRAVPPVPPVPPVPESISSAGAAEERAELELTLGDAKADPVGAVMAHYAEAMKANGFSGRDTPKRRKLVKRQLGAGFSAEQLCEAINGLTWSDWHMGRDPKSSGESYTDLKYAIGDAERIEANAQRARSPPTPRRAGGWR